jgi:uncharacterized protein YoxC
MEIRFTPELLIALPIYLGSTLAELSKNIAYGKHYLYKLADNVNPITEKANAGLNRMWNDLGLDYNDLNNIYVLIKLIEEGKSKINTK